MSSSSKKLTFSASARLSSGSITEQQARNRRSSKHRALRPDRPMAEIREQIALPEQLLRA